VINEMKLSFFKAAVSTTVSRMYAAIAVAANTAIGIDLIYFRSSTSAPILYLTFDDGPGPRTQQLIYYLNMRGARATFFFSGGSCDSQADAALILSSARQSGHVVGTHGYNHINAWSSSAAIVEDDHDLGLRRLEEIGSPDENGAIAWARPPFGRLTPALISWYRRIGLAVALWDVDPVDYGSDATAEVVIKFVRNTVRSGSLVLLHENSHVWADENGASLEQLMDALISDGWTLEALPCPGKWL